MIARWCARVLCGELADANDRAVQADHDLLEESKRAHELSNRVDALNELLGAVRLERDQFRAECRRLLGQLRRPPSYRQDGQWVGRDELIRLAHQEQIAEHWRAEYETLRAHVPVEVLVDIDKAMGR